jgi:hypothetical protein
MLTAAGYEPVFRDALPLYEVQGPSAGPSARGHGRVEV